MSSLVQGSQQTPNSQTPMGVGYVKSINADTIVLEGSFQGFLTTSSNYLASKTRGNFFTVSWVATGHYRVQLNGVSPLTTYTSTLGYTSANGGNAPGWPAGLIENPTVWLTNDLTPANLPAYYSSTGTSVTSLYSVAATPLDKTTNVNTFDIYCCASTALALPGVDVGTGDRINFRLVYKLTGYTP